MKRFVPLYITLICLICACNPVEESPNVVIILADDLGYGDPGIYNSDSKISTPHIDALAAAGMRFTDAHSPSSVCTPTRYGLLTGRYAWRTELKSSVLWSWDRPLIEEDRLTLPKMLKQQGYATACIGKWHLGWWWPSTSGGGYANRSLSLGQNGGEARINLWQQIDFTKPMEGGPLAAGFDYYFGDDVPNFPPYVFFENNRLLGVPGPMKPDSMFGNPGPMVDGWDLTKVMPAITQKAVEYIHQESKKNKPFFLYFSLTAPHTPIAPDQSFIGKSEAGRYGDYVHQVDGSVGEVVDALRASGMLENTLLIFTSDNGSPQRDGTNMNGKIATVKAYGHDPSKPWRGMKGDIWEGGHRVPFIASWPNRIPAGNTADQLVSQTDLMSSIAALLDIPIEAGAAVDGFDMSSILLGSQSESPIREAIVHHSLDGTFAIRQGNWKLILGKDSGGFSKNLASENTPVETAGQLYDLSSDPGEKSNLYAQYPEKVEVLMALLEKYQADGYSH
ncbi:MAG: arylsulfatase [Rhodothermales bacterium]